MQPLPFENYKQKMQINANFRTLGSFFGTFRCLVLTACAPTDFLSFRGGAGPLIKVDSKEQERMEIDQELLKPIKIYSLNI